MMISDIKIRKTFHQSKHSNLCALVSITRNQEFAVHDIKIIQGTERLFVAMPSRKLPDGKYLDICHPIAQETRQQVEAAILSAYHGYLETQESKDATYSNC